jgi:agmatinase
MVRYGARFGPDLTFLGVPRCDWQDPATFSGADVVILGAPFDGGTSFRAGARFGPQYIGSPATYRTTDPVRPWRCGWRRSAT